MQQRVDALVEDEHGRVLAACGGRRDELRGQRRLPGARCTHDQGAGASLDAAAEQRVHLSDVAGELVHDRGRAVFAGDQTRIDFDPSTLNDAVVIAAPEADAAELGDDEPPPFRAVFRVQLLQPNHAVRDALDLKVVGCTGQVVQEQYRAFSASEELLESEDLPAVAERVARQQSQFRERIEHDTRRLDPLDVGQDRSRRLAQLHLRRVEHGVLVVRPETVFARDQFADGDPVERPAMRRRDARGVPPRFPRASRTGPIHRAARLPAGTAAPSLSCPSLARLRSDTSDAE